MRFARPFSAPSRRADVAIGIRTVTFNGDCDRAAEIWSGFVEKSRLGQRIMMLRARITVHQ
jgi:hypothetical protein